MANNLDPDPPPISRENNPARRRIDGTFIAALIFTLRARGISVGPGEATACISLAGIQSDWAADELGPVLQAALIRRPEDTPIFAGVFGSLFTAQPVAPRPSAPAPPSPPPFFQPPPVGISRLRRAGGLADRLRVRI